MAIKVTKAGKRPEDRECHGTCSYCHTEVEYLASDGEVHSNQREGTSIKVRCPTCGKDIWGSYKKEASAYDYYSK